MIHAGGIYTSSWASWLRWAERATTRQGVLYLLVNSSLIYRLMNDSNFARSEATLIEPKPSDYHDTRVIDIPQLWGINFKYVSASRSSDAF